MLVFSSVTAKQLLQLGGETLSYTKLSPLSCHDIGVQLILGHIHMQMLLKGNISVRLVLVNF